MNDELELYEEFEETDLTELYSPNIRKQLNNYSHIWKRNLISNNHGLQEEIQKSLES